MKKIMCTVLLCALLAPSMAFALEEAAAVFQQGTLPSLKELYAPYFDFGSAVKLSGVRSGGLMDLFLSQFNIVTHENELKPEAVLDVASSRRLAQDDQTAVAINIDKAKPLLDLARQHGIKVHGHVLVWHSQTPEVFFREGYTPSGGFVARDIMLARLDNYIRLVFEQTGRDYPGIIVSWDVVNEAIGDAAGEMRQSLWTQVIGDDFVLEAFRIARKYAPKDVMLYYNDYSTPYEPKLTGILRLLEKLKAEGNIDGCGFQCHYQMGTPSINQIKNAMDKVIALGFPLRISEMDILVNDNSENSLRRQAIRYGEIFDVFRKYKDHIVAVHTWGIRDDLSWKAQHYPLLFDKNNQPKPAFFAITDLPI
ncbi:MAG: endo-1,4-beta-xylanase [Eubacteriales bacterium]|nr:endo-1,4-beta-xylanase [Eubacteriales bacterium]MDD4105754.1 endo-1,4-beta-xylanase [Eubacteriales bacterium]MDD4710260.1 endo-1,4-beta-xylanase [Eubacteriales bacterium]NLO14977.1 endo-1,4-beta-xylanase [Clostridiales bacterium]